jgi:hypothetical protein
MVCRHGGQSRGPADALVRRAAPPNRQLTVLVDDGQGQHVQLVEEL